MGPLVVLATVFLGQVRVETPHGAPRTHASAILALAKLTPGEALTFEKIQRAERELRSTNLFQNVHVSLLMPPEEAARLMYWDNGVARADVAIQLEEKRFWYAFPYGSVSTANYSFGGLVADVNLAGRAKTLFAAADWGNKTRQAYGLYRDPAVLGSRFVAIDLTALLRDDEVPLYVDRQTVDHIAVTQGGGALVLRLNWHRDFATLFQLSADHVDVGEARAGAMPLPTVNLRSGLDSNVRAELRYDSRLSEEGFYRGVITRLWVEFADDRVGSDFDYTREMMIFGGWYGFGPVHLSHRGQVGVEYATGPHGIPFTKEFTLGGSDLRGYVKREFRGDTTASLQNEAIFPLFQVWDLQVRGDVFYDAGLIYFSDRPFEREDFRQGIGGGLRVYFKKLAIPVVGVDIGYGLEENAVGYYFTFGLPEG
jgi:outer membrane protein assembly factor BamA